MQRNEKEITQMTHLDGIVERIMFKNQTNGYVVLELDTGSALTTVVGELGNVDEGEELHITGEYITHAKFGVQFKALLCERKLPETVGAIKKYLSSGIVKGIGAALAKRIVDEFGDKTLHIIENSPDELLKIKGISPKKYVEISEGLKQIFGIRRLMMYLSQYAAPPMIAVRAWKKWGPFSMDIIKENPYTLCNFDIEMSFFKAEELAAGVGIKCDNKNRIRAGISYILMDNSYSGHTCLPTDMLMKKTCEILSITSQDFFETLELEYAEENLCEYVKGNRPFTYLKDFYIAENFIAGRINVYNSTTYDSEGNYSNVIALEEERKGIEYEKLQKKAISLALSKGFMILTGGPGTGKTTTLNAIISLFEQQGNRVMIAAPTGRAAKRIADLTGYEAKTIHRLLEVRFNADGKLIFIHNQDNPVNCDVLIVDEMSMVDTLLFESLLRGLRLSCKLIMVGDSDQLPSVGAGNILKDLMCCGKITVVELKEIFRQASQSSIITNAHKILGGQAPDLTLKDNDFFFFQRLENTAALDTVVDLYKTRLPNAYGFIPTEDIQILSPTRKGILGTVEINKRLQEEINPSSSELSEVTGTIYTFRENDKVMQTKNNYDITWAREDEVGTGIFNGDVGKILAVRKVEGVVEIDFDGRITEFSLELLDQLELAYAITVHKSQGNEFGAVILPLLGGFDKLYYRSLLYTAVTRAKKLLIIVGSKNVVLSMIANNRRILRYSCLKKMIIGDEDV